MKQLTKRKKREAGLLVSAILLVLAVIGWMVLVLYQAEKTEERLFNGNSYSLLIENVEPETVEYVSRLRKVDHVWLLSAPELVSDRDDFELDIRYLNSPNFVETDFQLANGAFPSNETEVALGFNFATNFYPDMSFGDELVLQNEYGEEKTYTITGLFYEHDLSGINAVSIKNIQTTELGSLYAYSSVEDLGELAREIQAETGQYVRHQSWQTYDDHASLFDHTLLNNTFTILFISLVLILVGCCLRLKMLLDNVFNPHKQLYVTLGYSPKRMKRKGIYQAILSATVVAVVGALLIYAFFYGFGQTVGSALGIGLGGLMYQSTEYNPYIPFPTTIFFVFMLAVLVIVFSCFAIKQTTFFKNEKNRSFFLYRNHYYSFFNDWSTYGKNADDLDGSYASLR
ncbi:hypothetical protein JCM19046_880 [Bacillus sp. JCM 19046]|nr:hypothetical protein JCM19046_880 [Bacillus sp. JCM 19046]